MRKNLMKWIAGGLLLLLSCGLLFDGNTVYAAKKGLLTEPFLQLPMDTRVNVVWFTVFEGKENKVRYGEGLDKEVPAYTKKLSRMRKMQNGMVAERDIYRHEAIIRNLPKNTDGTQRIPYQVVSDGCESEIYELQTKQQPGVPMKILLTSDSQLKNMSAANMQKIKETVGTIDAVFYAGDAVNIPDQAEEWFDSPDRNSFFSAFQGTAEKSLNGKVYQGASILQYAPIFTAVGNHEVMGRLNHENDLGVQFNDPMPVSYAEELYEEQKEKVNPDNLPSIKKKFIQDNSFNTISYEEIFTLPMNKHGNELYYAVTIGDVRLVVLDVARVWRLNTVGIKSKYSEDVNFLEDKTQWGYGNHIFEAIKKGSEQYEWLEEELGSEAFQNAEYKVVMFHWQMHGLGGNILPAFTDPVRKEIRDESGNLTQILYEYPIQDDYLQRDVKPLLEEAGVDLVLNGHSHIWNRFKSNRGMNILETSNVGNTYDAFDGEKERTDLAPSDMTNFDAANYVLQGDPYGLTPAEPSIEALDGKDYIASNTITVFSVLDTETGNVDSYYFDTENPGSEVVKFDSFHAKRGEELQER